MKINQTASIFLAAGLLITLPGCQQDLGLAESPQPEQVSSSNNSEIILFADVDSVPRRCRVVKRYRPKGEVYRIAVDTPNQNFGSVSVSFYEALGKPNPESNQFEMNAIKSQGRNGKDIEWETGDISFSGKAEGTYVFEIVILDAKGNEVDAQLYKTDFSSDRNGRTQLTTLEGKDTTFDLVLLPSKFSKENLKEIMVAFELKSIEEAEKLMNNLPQVVAENMALDRIRRLTDVCTGLSINYTLK